MANGLLTASQKEAIRNMPCGNCGGVPPFPDGNRCHPHRVIPGSEGGQYTKANTVPRCPRCHDVEHGGEGAAPFTGASREGGFALHRTVDPKKLRQWCRKGGRRAREAMRKKYSPAALSAVRRRAGYLGALAAHAKHGNLLPGGGRPKKVAR